MNIIDALKQNKYNVILSCGKRSSFYARRFHEKLHLVQSNLPDDIERIPDIDLHDGQFFCDTGSGPSDNSSCKCIRHPSIASWCHFPYQPGDRFLNSSDRLEHFHIEFQVQKELYRGVQGDAPILSGTAGLPAFGDLCSMAHPLPDQITILFNYFNFNLIYIPRSQLEVSLSSYHNTHIYVAFAGKSFRSGDIC